MRVAVQSLCLIIWAALLAACTVQLVPSYDAALAGGLSEASDDALTLFAAVESGSPAAEFPDYEDRYAAIIGRLDALQHRAATRDMPPLARRLARSDGFARLCPGGAAEACLNASPESIATAASSVRAMRDTHRRSGLAPDLIPGFRRDFLLAIGRAANVEQSLNR